MIPGGKELLLLTRDLSHAAADVGDAAIVWQGSLEIPMVEQQQQFIWNNKIIK